VSVKGDRRNNEASHTGMRDLDFTFKADGKLGIKANSTIGISVSRFGNVEANHWLGIF
jgi:hypothetical protein